ncbi:Transposable element Tc3 transposase [Thelohanellus kitauei]|uniref:Transposable element Tc3 transposase n=1 Tax=Thelohanellus kitauei TaxID=669202 RepID=A0A0C2J3D9_THEKT|nr:Transposable element Tc3 transposase [Thelohanellus kitauei]
MLIENFVKTLPENTIFQQDNATCHVSKSTTNFFAQNNIQPLDSPTLSPYLNIIENVWAELSSRVYKNGRLFYCIHELWNVINTIGKKFKANAPKFVESIPKRIYIWTK